MRANPSAVGSVRSPSTNAATTAAAGAGAAPNPEPLRARAPASESTESEPEGEQSLLERGRLRRLMVSGLTQQEAARELGISAKAVGMRMRCARQRLHHALADPEQVDE